MGDLEEGDEVSSLVCNHTFHHECVHKWFQSRLQSQLEGCCPACNRQIFTPLVGTRARPVPIAFTTVAPSITFTDKFCGRTIFLCLGLSIASVILASAIFIGMFVAQSGNRGK
mmetsp:Transcript_62099/g.148541  ORF Transcript_62099/g.148541 Transcript_62099/m.148541 type:complete len:113 (-) Transcript_62099:161-499(-)